MHPCLHIDEVIENIASHVEDNRTLTRLALVCRAFVEPATDALWAHLSGLEPLLSCLSSDLMGPSQRSYRALTIRAPPTLAGWARFRHYARKVKSLHIRPANLRKLQDNGGTTILAEHHPDGVLPNLKHLRWHEQWGSETLALAFMRPSLSTLTYVGNTTQALRTVMEHVRANLPQLNDFTCSYDSLYLPPDDSIVNEFSDTILALGNLTTFLYTSNVLRSDAVLHLSRIPHLTTLSVVLDSETHELWINPRSGGFCALTNLTLRVCPMEGGLSPCVRMLQTLSGLALTNLELNISTPSIRAGEYADLVSAIGRFRHLRDCLIVGSRLSGDPAHAAHAIDASALTPLHALSDMRRFHQRSIPVALYPESARQLAAAWPRLEDLAIRAHSVEHRLYRELRRDDLLALARSFPSAEALAAPVHPVRDDQAYNPSAIDPPPSASNSFGLGESANLARAVDGMAACLAKMFAPARLEDDWVEVERSGAE